MESPSANPPEPPPPRTRLTRRERIRRAMVTAAVLLGAVTMTGIVLTYAGARSYRWRGFDLEVSVRPVTEGRTRLIFAPLGEVRARTHRAPLELNVALKGLSFDKTRKLVLNPPSRKELEDDFLQTARASLQSFAFSQMALGSLAALAIPLIARSRRSSHWIGSSLLGAGAVAVCFYQMSATYRPQAFENPTYTGSLREAGWIIGLAKDGFAKAEALSERLKRVATNVSALYGRLNSAAPLIPAEDAIKVLHVSDIHNNTAAIAFVRELANRTAIDLVVDTGDLTDLGLPVETELVSGLAGLTVPYLFVAGNHDSRATVTAVSGFARSRILDSEPVEVAGLSVLGVPDPSSRRPGSGSVDTPEATLRAEGESLAVRMKSMSRVPDIVAVHNPRMAEPLIGAVPLVLCGHMHKMDIEQRGGTVICNAGTTGAAGVRYFEKRGGVPFTAAILGFTRTSPPSLAFIDQVSLDGSLGQYSITRRTFGSARQ